MMGFDLRQDQSDVKGVGLRLLRDGETYIKRVFWRREGGLASMQSSGLS